MHIMVIGLIHKWARHKYKSTEVSLILSDQLDYTHIHYWLVCRYVLVWVKLRVKVHSYPEPERPPVLKLFLPKYFLSYKRCKYTIHVILNVLNFLILVLVGEESKDSLNNSTVHVEITRKESASINKMKAGHGDRTRCSGQGWPTQASWEQLLSDRTYGETAYSAGLTCPEIHHPIQTPQTTQTPSHTLKLCGTSHTLTANTQTLTPKHTGVRLSNNFWWS